MQMRVITVDFAVIMPVGGYISKKKMRKIRLGYRHGCFGHYMYSCEL